MIHGLSLGFTKLAVLLLYQRQIPSPFYALKRTNLDCRIFLAQIFSYIIWTLIGVTVVWTIVFLVANLLECIPFFANWDPLAASSTYTAKMLLAQSWSDVFTDGRRRLQDRCQVVDFTTSNDIFDTDTFGMCSGAPS